MSDDAFGFQRKPELRRKVGAITPSSEPVDHGATFNRIDDAGERHGFISREREDTFKRTRTVGPVVTLHTRAPLRVATPFQKFCEENRYSYWEGIEELMKRAGIGT